MLTKYAGYMYTCNVHDHFFKTFKASVNTKIINSTKLRNNIASVLDAVNKEHLFYIITHRDKQEHAIVNLDKLEDLLAASDPKYLADIATARRQTAAGEIFALEDAFDNA